MFLVITDHAFHTDMPPIIEISGPKEAEVILDAAPLIEMADGLSMQMDAGFDTEDPSDLPPPPAVIVDTTTGDLDPHSEPKCRGV